MSSMRIDSTEGLVEILKEVQHIHCMLADEVMSPEPGTLFLAKDCGEDNARYSVDTHEKASIRLLDDIKAVVRLVERNDNDFRRYREKVESDTALRGLRVKLGEDIDDDFGLYGQPMLEEELREDTERFEHDCKLAKERGLDRPYQNYPEIWGDIKGIWWNIEWLLNKYVKGGAQLNIVVDDAKSSSKKNTDDKALYTLSLSGNRRNLLLNNQTVQRLNYGSSASKLIPLMLEKHNVPLKAGSAVNPIVVINNLKLPKMLKKIMFNTSKGGVFIKNPVTADDLLEHGVDRTEIDRELKLTFFNIK